MTQDETIELARQAGIVVTGDAVLKLCQLVAVKEREACAKLCETLGVHPALNVWDGGPDWYKHGKDCATAIRARGQA